MRLFLIRHGETVDNVAGLYAGSRDSALTTHGVLQARRLATHLAEQVTLTHLFASNLGRAVKTAEAICDVQKRTRQTALEVVQLTELREKHFGTGEGVKYGIKGPKVEHHGAETPEAMKLRVDAFLDDYLVPLLIADDGATVCVVSHGIILAVLFSALCARLPSGSISVTPEAQSTSFPGSDFIRPTWSNTGYLEGVMSAMESSKADENPRLGFKLFIKSVNCVDHVKGLKKTRGGIGSAKFDDKQKTMDSFFEPSRKRKLEDEESLTTPQWYVHFFFHSRYPEAHDEKIQIHRPVPKYICGKTCPTAI